jgi:hypothetical protein
VCVRRISLICDQLPGTYSLIAMVDKYQVSSLRWIVIEHQKHGLGSDILYLSDSSHCKHKILTTLMKI